MLWTYQMMRCRLGDMLQHGTEAPAMCGSYSHTVDTSRCPAVILLPAEHLS